MDSEIRELSAEELTHVQCERGSTQLNLEQLDAVSGGLMASVLSNLANMRHEMLKTVANNLRA